MPQNRQPSKKNATSFKGGRSGNPGGRPRLGEDAREFLRLHRGPMTIQALKTTARLLESKDEHVAARVANDWLNKVLPDASHVEEQLRTVLDRIRSTVDAATYEKIARAVIDAEDGS